MQGDQLAMIPMTHTEAAAIGLLGGLLGTFAGIGTVLAVTILNGWTAVVPTGLLTG